MTKKVPVGNIPLEEAFSRYQEHRWRNFPALELSPENLQELTGRSKQGSDELSAAFANGQLEARVHDGNNEWTITPMQWQQTFSPEHAFYGGSIIGDSPYQGLYPYTGETAFTAWLRTQCSDDGVSGKRRADPEDCTRRASEERAMLAELLAKWPDETKRPTDREMARQLSTGSRKPETVRKRIAEWRKAGKLGSAAQ